VFAMLFLFIAIFVLDHPLFLLPLTVGIAVTIFLSGSVANIRWLRIFFFFISVFTLLIWSVFYRQGTPLFSLGWFHPTGEGVLFGLGMAIKLSTFLATGTLFLSTTRVEEFAFALTSLGVPYRLGFTMTLAFRLVPIFLDATLTVIQAQRCRGLDVHGGGVMERLRRYIPVLIPVF
jgi:energy-coupling factor transport system permease protein